MTFEDCLVVVIGEDDRLKKSLYTRIEKKCPDCEVRFAHAPIGTNLTVLLNDLYTALTKSTREHIIVVRESEIDEVDFTSVLNTFKSSRSRLSKPLLARLIGSAGLKECEHFNLLMEVVVAKRDVLFATIEEQFRQ